MLQGLRLLPRSLSEVTRRRIFRLGADILGPAWSSQRPFALYRDQKEARPTDRVPKGRVWAYAKEGDAEALAQALDSGCSTEECDDVSLTVRAFHFKLRAIASSVILRTA